MKGNYQGHGIQLFVAPEIRNAIVQFMAKNGLDKEYAAQLLLVKALYQEQLISREVYEVYSYKYSRKIVFNALDNRMSLDQLKTKQEFDSKTRLFRMVAEQWSLDHKPGWREGWLVQAEQYKNLVPEAKVVLELAKSGK